ncbi:hypothetical protein L1887_24149 [Cichorium endivia]|nr:hypothetical protein L1887_24149 [Cichorium endivia]
MISIGGVWECGFEVLAAALFSTFPQSIITITFSVSFSPPFLPIHFISRFEIISNKVVSEGASGSMGPVLNDLKVETTDVILDIDDCVVVYPDEKIPDEEDDDAGHEKHKTQTVDDDCVCMDDVIV